MNERLVAGVLEGAAQGLTIDCHNLTARDFDERVDPPAKRFLERRRVDERENPTEGIMRRNPLREVEKRYPFRRARSRSTPESS